MTTTKTPALIPEEISLFDNPSISKTKGFALARYSKDMTLLQRRMLAIALSQIQESDTIDKSYNINVKELASLLHINAQTLSRNISLAAKTMMGNNQTIYFEKDDGWINSVLIESIERKNGYNFEIKFGSKLMPILLEMKKKYDIIYSLKSTLFFKSKYSHLLYDFLLATAAAMDRPSDGVYQVEVEANNLVQILSFTTRTKRYLMSQMNTTAINPAIRDINENSEIHIENDRAMILRDKSGIIGYVFRYTVKDSQLSLVAAKEQMKILNNIYYPGDLPSWETLTEKMRKMGVSESLIKKIEFEDKTLRTWKNIVYTTIHGNDNPKYFNRAYNEDYANQYSIQELIEELERSKENKAHKERIEKEIEESTPPLFSVDIEPEPLDENKIQTEFFKRKLEEFKRKREEKEE